MFAGCDNANIFGYLYNIQNTLKQNTHVCSVMSDFLRSYAL